MNESKDALDVLKQTSRTFFIPISRLPVGLKEAVASAYLCMRAIDEVEDHPTLDNAVKAQLLQQMSSSLQAGGGRTTRNHFQADWGANAELLPDVTLRFGDWAALAPDSIAPRIWDATAAMADRMAHWASVNWQIDTESDLDRYTFSVAGAVGLLLSDLWAWHDGTLTDRTQAIGFGRGLQAVNVLRNYKEDRQRGVSFFPEGWDVGDLQNYARRNLLLADSYTNSLPKGPAKTFCQIPLVLAWGTLDTLALGKDKLSRSDVMALIAPFTNRQPVESVK
ncbi:MAG: phytoene/squalene synthase family protein [Spirulinaceae cyanobacterium RM2_2_10]|nr:phytoene/squalene synthase family protein [Spirulinaceae cyanobacterium SM2_1_0]NJO20574.1 phytoene/squalene synthase family protein [Spirulinaceae cyanobacterium RM2_2_10]